MKASRSLWKDFLKKRFCHFNTMIRSAWSRAITAFANELAVGDNGALDVTLMRG